jgi:hypothetical protein
MTEDEGHEPGGPCQVRTWYQHHFWQTAGILNIKELFTTRDGPHQYLVSGI